MLSSAMSAGKQIPTRITEVLERMRNMYGGNLVITRVTASEIELHARNMTDARLIADMMTRKNEIFGAFALATGAGCVLGPPDFQILCEQAARAGQTGLFLRYLPNTPNRQDYLAGYWFY
ncbi:MAG TPA: hypothetical protein VE959_07730 [Bryobacteraceae bacterium]|nr:hypothetical protein [Bryobacteraceae bacterium]